MLNFKNHKKAAFMHDNLGMIIIFALVLLVIIGILVISNNKLKEIIFGYL